MQGYISQWGHVKKWPMRCTNIMFVCVCAPGACVTVIAVVLFSPISLGLGSYIVLYCVEISPWATLCQIYQHINRLVHFEQSKTNGKSIYDCESGIYWGKITHYSYKGIFPNTTETFLPLDELEKLGLQVCASHKFRIPWLDFNVQPVYSKRHMPSSLNSVWVDVLFYC